MAISFECPQCGRKLKAPDSAVGKSSKCPGCGNKVTCPAPAAQAEVVDTKFEAAPPGDPYSDLDDGKPYGLVEEEPVLTPTEETRRPCPACGEMIIASAAKCRYCGEVFDPVLKKAAGKKVVGIKSGKKSDLRSVAVAQKVIVACVGIYLAIVVLSLFRFPVPVRIVLGLAVLVVGLVGTVFTFILALRVYSTAVGILLCVLTLIPCVNVIILLTVNAKATKILRANGCPVGLFGADLSKV